MDIYQNFLSQPQKTLKKPDFHSNSQLAAALSPLQTQLALCNLFCPTPRDA